MGQARLSAATSRAYSGDDGRPLPDHLARDPVRRTRAARPAHRRRALGPGAAGRRAGGLRRGSPAGRRSSSTSTLTSPRPAGLVVIPSPTPRRSASDSRPSGSGRRTRSSPTTTWVARSRPGCGGCSTTSGTSASPCSTAGSVPGSRPATRSRPIRRRLGHGAGSTLGDAWTNVIDRDARGRGPRLDGAARRAGGAALPRRGRTDRPGPRPHPDRHERADRRHPRSRRATARSGGPRRALP